MHRSQRWHEPCLHWTAANCLTVFDKNIKILHGLWQMRMISVANMRNCPYFFSRKQRAIFSFRQHSHFHSRDGNVNVNIWWSKHGLTYSVFAELHIGVWVREDVRLPCESGLNLRQQESAGGGTCYASLAAVVLFTPMWGWVRPGCVCVRRWIGVRLLRSRGLSLRNESYFFTPGSGVASLTFFIRHGGGAKVSGG